MAEPSSRITIMIGNENHKKLRTKQAYLIKKDQTNYSFSKVINMVLDGKLKL